MTETTGRQKTLLPYAQDNGACDYVDRRKVRVLSDLVLPEVIWAVKEAARFSERDCFYQHLLANLPQNSAETRTRYTRGILARFFDEGPPAASLPTRVWSKYLDEVLLAEIVRFVYLQNETIVGQCVSEALYPVSNGALVPHSYLDNYAQKSTGVTSGKTNRRLRTTLRKLGVLVRAKVGYDLLKETTPSPTAVLLVFHYRFARREPRSIEMAAILADPFWKYLGLKSEDGLRRVFRDADNAGRLGKYIIADQLELVTPRYTLDQFLEEGIRL